ncbi:MAG: hypothetical protein SGBAC_003996 [Bacillariaceae sp.]
MTNHNRNDAIDIEQKSSFKPYPFTRVDSSGLPIPPPPAESAPIAISKGLTSRSITSVRFGNNNVNNPPQEIEESRETESTNSQQTVIGEVLNVDPKERWSMYRKHVMFLLFMIILIVLVVSAIVLLIVGSSTERNGHVGIPVAPLSQAPTGSDPYPTLSPVEFGATTVPSPATLPSLSPTYYFEGAIRDFLFQDNTDLLLSPDSLGVQKAVNWLVEEAKFAQSLIFPFNQKYLQRFGILLLYFSIFQNESNEGVRTQDECLWKGMTCNENGMLTKIKLSKRQLNGALPSEWRLLPSLKCIDFSNNRLQGSIPEEIYDILGLEEVFLYHNDLSGTISSKIGRLWNLTHFQVSHNQLSGSIPSEIASAGSTIRQLRYFDVHRNQMTGSIPSNMRLRQMFYLDLGYNGFSGTLPNDMGTDYVRLRHLHLDHNNFVGTFPKSYLTSGDWRILTVFVNDNNLSGVFPGIDRGVLRMSK